MIAEFPANQLEAVQGDATSETCFVRNPCFDMGVL